LIHIGKSREKSNVAKAVQNLADADLLQHVGEAAVQVIDEYMTNGAEDTIYLEPEFQKTNDLNAFLKSEKLGKSDEFSPNLRIQLSLAKRIFRRGGHLGAVNKVLTNEA
jgi:hypothetical protein